MDAIKNGMLATAKAAEAAARLCESLFNKTFKFNSQICTSQEQSERLLALGLKKETADMRWERIGQMYGWYISAKTPYASSDIPAWSLARLVEMIPTYVGGDMECQITRGDISYRLWNERKGRSEVQKIFAKESFYDAIIDCIEWLIKEGYFNKEYLEE